MKFVIHIQNIAAFHEIEQIVKENCATAKNISPESFNPLIIRASVDALCI